MREEGQEGSAAAALLAWYDRAARVLPWRVPPNQGRGGQRPDPYRVWLSEVMLQQTTVAAVRSYFHRFTTLWPSVADLAAASDQRVMAEWAGLGYYARARNLLACARAVVRDHGGTFPGSEAALARLPGIGPYTAAAVAAIAFDQPATVVDGNVERVVARLWAVKDAMPGAKAQLRQLAARLGPGPRPGDHAQAMMDLGATICTPRNPACADCPLSFACAAYAQGIAAQLPRKAVKPAKPVRQGLVWVAFHPDGRLATELRPSSGLLGGMRGFPGDGWDGSKPQTPPPDPQGWTEAGSLRHTFTHFHLDLRVMTCRTPLAPMAAQWGDPDAQALPTLMRKAHDLARAKLTS